VHDNHCDGSFNYGISVLGAGLVRVENNFVDHSGILPGIGNASQIANIFVDTRLTDPFTPTTVVIKNNTLGANTDHQIRIYDSVGSLSTSGNIICNSGNDIAAVSTFHYSTSCQ
jgi:hypothetical protein